MFGNIDHLAMLQDSRVVILQISVNGETSDAYNIRGVVFCFHRYTSWKWLNLKTWKIAFISIEISNCVIDASDPTLVNQYLHRFASGLHIKAAKALFWSALSISVQSQFAVDCL